MPGAVVDLGGPEVVARRIAASPGGGVRFGHPVELVHAGPGRLVEDQFGLRALHRNRGGSSRNG